MSLTEQFKKKYIPGFDCRLSTFRNSLACNNIILTNSMMLGLSGALIFCFNDGHFLSRVPFFVVSGISDQTIEKISSSLNIYLFRGRMLNIENAIEQIPRYLSKNIPLNIAINRYALFEITGRKNNKDRFNINMGFHYVTLTDFDKKEDKFTIFETDSSIPIILNRDQLEYIWFYDILNQRKGIDPFQLCDGQWYSFLCKDSSKRQLIKGCFDGIENVLINFYKSPVDSVLGINALHNFKTKMHFWKDQIDDIKYFCDSISFMSVMESGLSGGGFGRKLFSYFLNEFSVLIGNDELKIISYEFTNQAKHWSILTKKLANCISFDKQYEIDMNKLKSIIDQDLDSIIDSEIRCMQLLNKWMIINTLK